MAHNRDYMNDELYKAARLQGAGIPSAIDDDDDDALLRLTPGDESNVLHVAAECGNQGFISAVLDRVPAAVHYELLCKHNSEGETPLHLAAKIGDKGTVQALLLAHDKDCAGPNKPCWSEKDKHGDTPLHTALRYGHDDIALLLLEKDVELLVSMDSDVGESPAYLAAANSCTGFLNRVLDADRDGECRASFAGPFGQTAFYPARKLNGDILSKLVERRKNILKLQDKRGKTILHYAVEEKSVSVVETLLKADSSLAYLDDGDGLTPLHKAASMGSISMMQAIMELSPQSIRIRDKHHSRTALHLAKMDACSLEELLRNTIIKELINQVDNDGNTPLHLALINSDLLTADKLLDVDNINWRLINKEGNCPMNLCSDDNHIARKLKRLETSCKVNMEIFFKKNVINVDDVLDNYPWEQCLRYRGLEGETILHVAARDGSMKIINKLHESNDDYCSLLSTRNIEGETPLHLAAQHGQFDVVKFILSLCTSGDRIDENNSTILALENGDGNRLIDVMPWRMKSANGDTPAHKAVKNGHAAIALLLLKQDLELISFTNDSKESILYLAIESGCASVVKHIVSKDVEFNDSITSGRDGQNIIHAVGKTTGGQGLIMKKPELLKKVDANGKTPLHYVGERNFRSTARLMLEQDKSAAFMYDNDGFTPLMIAASLNHVNCFTTMLKLCPQSAKLRDLHNGRTVLHLAKMTSFSLKICMRYQAMVKLVNETDNDGNTALHRAILDGDIDKALVLLDTHGLYWNIKNKLHQSPLDLCKELLRNGETKQRPVQVGLVSLDAGRYSPTRSSKFVSYPVKKLLMSYANMIMTDDNAKKLVDNIAVASGLLLTITSAAAFTIPGGYDQNTGDAMRVKEYVVKVFMASDVLAMLMCVSILVRYTLGVGGRREELRKLAVDSIIMLQISLLATTVAFISAAYAVGSPFKSIINIPIIVVAALNFVIFFRVDFFEFIF